LAAVTIVALMTAAWFHFRSATKVKALAIGDTAPLVRLIDLDSSEPLLMLGLKGKVVWIVFWSAEANDAPKTLAAIARASSKIKAHRRFSMLTAAIEADKPDKVRAVIGESGVDLPVYLAGADSRLRFGAETADPALHVLIDAVGQVITIARGVGQSTLDRIALQAERQLEELDPDGNTRFAGMNPQGAVDTQGVAVGSDQDADWREARLSASAPKTQFHPSSCLRPSSSSGTPEWCRVTWVSSPRGSSLTVTVDSAPLVPSDIHVYSTRRGRSIWTNRPKCGQTRPSCLTAI
jgi:hypothetical protein